MELKQLKQATPALAEQDFRLGNMANHFHQAQVFICFCDHYQLSFIDRAISTMCYYIIHLSSKFTSSKSVRNYISRVKFLHKQLGLGLEVLNRFPVASLLRAEELTMRTIPIHQRPILPHLLTQLCHMSGVF